MIYNFKMKICFHYSLQLIIMMYLFIFIDLFLPIKGCYIWGTDSGECLIDGLDSLWRKSFMPYCAASVNYPVCVPKFQTLPASREFPNGRWYNNTITTKDNWVKDNCEAHMYERMMLERNRTLQRANQNEYGDVGKIKRRMYRGPNCRKAYQNLFCWINFPRCDPTRDLTLPTCKSACENYFISCKFSKDLWRCGKSKYFNGYEPEVPTENDLGNLTYLRDYFPGQPFRTNKFTRRGLEYPICTPAIDGSAMKQYNIIPNIYLVLLLIMILYCILC